MTLELVVLGCSGGYGAPDGGGSSGYLVRSGTTVVWLDCGSGTLATLQRHVDLADLTAAVVSHRHPDHCTDLLGLHVAYRYGLGVTDFPVLAAPEVHDALEPLARGLGEAFAWDEVGDGSERSVGSLRLRFSRTDHSVPTLAVEVSDADHRLVYTADTGPDWSAAKAFGPGADLLLAEATFQENARFESRHLTAAEAGAMGRDAAAGELILTHLWPTLDPALSVAEAMHTFGPAVTLARPGLVHRVGTGEHSV